MRRSYTQQFRRKVARSSSTLGYSGAGRKFKVSPITVKAWAVKLGVQAQTLQQSQHGQQHDAPMFDSGGELTAALMAALRPQIAQGVRQGVLDALAEVSTAK